MSRSASPYSQVASLKRQHQVLGETVFVPGWAIAAANTSYSFLQPLEAALAQHPDIDTVYFISDFALGDNSENDTEGRLRLQRLLGDRRIRLYLSTVNVAVPADYARIAVESGGGVLGSQ